VLRAVITDIKDIIDVADIVIDITDIVNIADIAVEIGRRV
jgi:hypothetical protein